MVGYFDEGYSREYGNRGNFGRNSHLPEVERLTLKLAVEVTVPSLPYTFFHGWGARCRDPPKLRLSSQACKLGGRPWRTGTCSLICFGFGD